MAAITIHDLPLNQALDAQAMSSVRGGGAPWVFGWITPYDPGPRGGLPVLNFYHVTNNFFAEQMINQFQTVQVNNTAPSSNISVVLSENARNSKQ
jgi:hypothetical protein